MRRHSAFLVPAGVAIAIVGFLAPSAEAGSAHFVGTPTATASGSTLTVKGKEAGLGNLEQVNIQVTADAQCVNKGGNKPSAENKQAFGGGGQFPVQNGKANFSVTVTANFQPKCSPPMSLVWSNVVVTDTTNGISVTLAGPF
ncbi:MULTISPECIES: hypothetical protein [Streptomyces]|uniref:Uncharacterized protein n=1 Tax=Streptomyces solicathayae TaxID=3081768 RepID=A0ABZ0LY35_9ACTN|nr:hypothetical protein [Streptomyces sp. HUAS YS2]WOX24255.1 hypothetical protein R2D22_23900 [Streptomyces sp. HUAS YS2]